MAHHGNGECRCVDPDADQERNACPHGTNRLPVGTRCRLQGCDVRMDEIHRQPGACRWGVGLIMKGKSIAYWTTTVLVAFFMSGGVTQVAQFKNNPHGVVPELGYPMYFFAIIGVWESAWSRCHPRAAFSAAQGMGVCRHLLRPDRRRHILRRSRRLRRLRLSRHRPAFDWRSDCDIVGAAAAQPHHWRPPSRDKHRGSVNTLELLG